MTAIFNQEQKRIERLRGERYDFAVLEQQTLVRVYAKNPELIETLSRPAHSVISTRYAESEKIRINQANCKDFRTIIGLL